MCGFARSRKSGRLRFFPALNRLLIGALYES
jgi:hypothetical protein